MRLLPLLPLILAVGACAKPPPPFAPWAPIPLPQPDAVETVVFLIGDAGTALPGANPVLARARDDIERWSAALGRDSAVVVVFLGDLIYPVGLRPPDHPERETDSLRLAAHVDAVTGPAALEHGTFAYFVAGNHDWGLARGVDGVRRLQNTEEFLVREREAGAPVGLVPTAGTPGPVVIDRGTRTRIILFDSAWWLLWPDSLRRDSLVNGVHEALATAGERRTIIGAHHPWDTAGRHGGLVPFWETLGLRMLLSRSGTLLQDLHSGPYRRLRQRLTNIFRSGGPPFIWAGGHDHSLQVLTAREPHDPRFTLVSGSAGKVTDVGWLEGLDFAAPRPGYMRLMIRTDGAVDLFVEATGREYKVCPAEDPERATCMEEGLARFGTVFSAHLAPVRSEVSPPAGARGAGPDG